METNKLSEKINQKTAAAPPRGALKIGQAAKKLGISVDTLRRWEEEGKITSIKSAGGTRYYNLSMLRKIRQKLLKKQKPAIPVENLKKAHLTRIPFNELRNSILIQVKTYKMILLPAVVFGFGLLLLAGLLFRDTSSEPILSRQETASSLAAANQQEQQPEQQGQVLAAQTGKNYLNIKLDTIIKGDLTVGKVNGIAISENMGPGQDLEITSAPTFSNINLTATSNQLAFGQGGVTGTLTWTPASSAKIITLPDATTTLVGINTTQTITNKTISGSDNTISNIQSSALSGSYTGVTGLGTITTGTWNGTTIATGNGGTGLTTYTTGDLLYSSASNTLKSLNIGSSGQYLTVAGGLPAWGTLSTITDLAGGAASVTGILPVANGGTGASTLTSNGILYGSGTSAISATSAGTSGQILLANASGVPVFVSMSGDAAINSLGALSIASGAIGNDELAYDTGQNLTTASIPTFGGLYATGNVGIGTTSPSSLLYVAGIATIAPTSGSGPSLSIKASPSASNNIFEVTNSAGTSTYFSINSSGKLNTSAFQLTDINNAIVGTAIEGAWTMNSNTYSYRRIVTVTGDGSTTIPQNYETTLDLDDTASSQVYTNSQTDCDDVRVAYSTNGSTFTEIARNIDTCTSGNVVLKFQLQAAITDGGTSSNYYLYYDSSALAAGSTFDATDITLDNGDTVGSWTSSDAGYPLSQETTIINEGTGSIQQGPTTADPGLGNIGTFSTTGQTQLPIAFNSPSIAQLTLSGTSYLYIVGGYSGGNNQSIVYKATINPDNGNITSITSAGQTQFPFVHRRSTSIAATFSGTNYLYVIGGSAVTSMSTVYRAVIDSSGNVQTFDTTGQAQLPVANSHIDHSSFLYTTGGTNYLYVMGGTGATSTLYRAVIDSSGNVQTFDTTGQAQLATTGFYRNYASITVGATNYLYTLGGGDNNSSVYKATIDSSGNVQVFSTTGQAQLPGYLNNNSSAFGVATTNVGESNYIYVLGGQSASGRVSTVYAATIDSSGNITGSFSTTNQGQLPQTLADFGLTTVTTGGTQYIYILGGYTASGDNVSTVYKATVGTHGTYTASKTLSSNQDLSNKSAITFDFYSSRTGSYMVFEISEDNSTWQTHTFSVSSANTWETKTYDISGIASGSKDAIRYIRFRVTDPSTAFTAYFDNILAKATSYSGGAVASTAASPILGSSNLDVNAQGTGIVRVNYDGTNSLAGTGGLAVYNGGTTSLFAVDGSGNVSAIGTTGLTLSGAGADLTFSGSGTHTISASSGTLALTTSDWGISATGALTGISGITNDEAYTQSGVSANTFTGTSTFSNATYSALFTGGNVGIGTTAPASPLAVTAPTTFTTGTLSSIIAPAAALTGALTGLNINVSGTTPGTQSVTTLSTSAFTGGGNGSTNYGLNIGAVTGSGTSINYGGYIGTISGGSTNNIGLRITGTAAAAANYGLYVDAAAQNYFAGNVGIGTTSAVSLLDVNGKFNVTSGGNVGVGTTAPSGLFDVNSKLTVLSGGNVGIGTTSPSSLLYVAGTTTLAGATTIAPTTAATALTIAAAPSGSNDIFKVTSSDGATTYFSVDSTGQISSSALVLSGSSQMNLDISSTEPTEQLTNTGFETDTSNWTTPDTTTLMQDDFTGSTIDASKWTETDANNWITQNNVLNFANPHTELTSFFTTKLVSVATATSGIVNARGNLTWTTDSTQEATGGLFLHSATNTYASITSRSNTGGRYRLRVIIGGVTQYDNNTSVTKGKDVQITYNTATNSIKFYYLDGSTWTQMGTTQTYNLGSPLYYGITSQDNTGGFDGANPVTVDDASFTNIAIDATRDTSIKYNSSAASAKLVADTEATGNYIQSVNVGSTQSFTLTGYAYTDSNPVTDADVELYYNGSTITTAFESMGSGWYKMTGTLTGANASRDYGVQVKAGKTVYIDNMSLVQGRGADTTLYVANSGTGLGKLAVEATSTLNSGASDLQALIIKGAASQTADLMQWQASTGSVLGVINASGNIGIGTTSASALLSVGSTSQFQINSSGAITALTGITTSGGYTQSGAGVNTFTGNIIFGGSTGILGSNGNVGIGTTAPTDKLDIGGAVKIGSGYAGIGTTAPANGLLVQGNVGIGTTSPSAPLEVKGNGSIIAKFTDNNDTGCSLSEGGVLACSSDINLKKNIDTISYGLDALMTLNPVAFNWKTDNDSTLKSLGFIAQDIEKIIPNLVTADSDTGLKQLNTIGLIPVLTKSIQEQQNEISSLNQKMLELEDKFALFTVASSAKESTSSASENTPGVSPGQTSSASATPEATSSGVSFGSPEVGALNLTPPEILLSTTSAKLVNLEVTSDAAISGKLVSYDLSVQNIFKSLGQTFLGNTTVAGGFSIDGTMSITGNSINSIACANTPGVGFDSPGVDCGTLFLQNSPLSKNLDIFNGKVTISKDGLVAIQGLAVSAKTLGTITIPAGQSHLDIPNINLTPNSKVFTAISKPIPIGVKKEIDQKKIILLLDKAQSEDIQVDWWVIESTP